MNLRRGPSGPFDLPSTPDLASLAHLGELQVDAGQIVWVETLERPFVAAAGIAVPFPGQVVPALDGSLSWRSLSGFSPRSGPWASRTDWHIDAVAGSVEGTGSASSPLSSWAELKARLDNQQLRPGTKVTLHTSLAEVLDFSLFIQDSAGPLEITGDPGATVLAADTVNTYTAETVVAPGESPILIGNTIADWTPYVARRIRFVNGPPAGGYSASARVNPGGAGLNRTRLCRPIVPAYPAGTYVTPAAGNVFVVEALPSVLGLAANASQPANPVILRGIAFPEARTPVNATNLAFWGCTGGNLQNYVVGLNVQGCRMGNPSDVVTGWGLYTNEAQIRCCVLFGLRSYGSRSDMRNIVGQGGAMLYGGITDIYNSGFFDSTTDGVSIIRAGAFAYGSTAVYGYGNASYGIQVYRGLSGMTYAAKPVITGTTANCRITGTNYTWAALPAALNTLGAGIVTP